MSFGHSSRTLIFPHFYIAANRKDPTVQREPTVEQPSHGQWQVDREAIVETQVFRWFLDLVLNLAMEPMDPNQGLMDP